MAPQVTAFLENCNKELAGLFTRYFVLDRVVGVPKIWPLLPVVEHLVKGMAVYPWAHANATSAYAVRRKSQLCRRARPQSGEIPGCGFSFRVCMPKFPRRPLGKAGSPSPVEQPTGASNKCALHLVQYYLCPTRTYCLAGREIAIEICALCNF